VRAIAVTALVVAAIAGGAWLIGQRRGAVSATRDPTLVALYRRGVHAYSQRTPASVGEAVQAFTAAVRRDSTYAEAWAGLAKAYVRAYERSFVIPGVARDSVLRLAVAAADRALSSDPRSADAWATRASVSRIVDPTDRAPAIRALRQSLALDSSDADAWHFLALSLAESGDLDGAFRAWHRAARLDPSNVQALAFLSIGYWWRHQYDSATPWADSAIAVDPTFLLARTSAGYVAVERGDFARARADFDAAERLSSEIEVLNAVAGEALAAARAGDTSQARALMGRAESLATAYSPAPLHTVVYMAEAYAGLGDADQAVVWLRGYAPRGDLHFQLHLRCDPPLASIETDPRFLGLLLGPRPGGARGC
jgi:tetratricopeptide (TPR) repeat protein